MYYRNQNTIIQQVFHTVTLVGIQKIHYKNIYNPNINCCMFPHSVRSRTREATVFLTEVKKPKDNVT